MVNNFAIFGSNCSLDIFNENNNPDYTKYFNVVSSISEMSLISLMSETYDEEDIQELGLNIELFDGENANETLTNEFKKTFLVDLKNNNVDYLIFDNLFESQSEILLCKNDIIFTKKSNLINHPFFENEDSFEVLSMDIDSKKYFELWARSINSFFEFLNQNCPNTEVILHKIRNNDILMDDGNFITDFSLNYYCNRVNPIINRFDKYIEENFNVTVLELNQLNYPIDKNYFRGFNSSNFVKSYYEDCFNKLNNHVNYEKRLSQFKKGIENKNEVIEQLNNAFESQNSYSNSFLTNKFFEENPNFLLKEYVIYLESRLNTEVQRNLNLKNELENSFKELKVRNAVKNDKLIFDNNSDNWVMSNGNLLTMDDCFSITKINVDNVCLAYPNCLIGANNVIEFDFYFDGIVSSNVISLRSNKNVLLNLSLKQMGLNAHSWHHLVVCIEDNDVLIFNSNNSNIVSGEVVGVNRIYLRIGGADNEIRCKNFKIYSL